MENAVTTKSPNRKDLLFFIWFDGCGEYYHINDMACGVKGSTKFDRPSSAKKTDPATLIGDSQGCTAAAEGSNDPAAVTDAVEVGVIEAAERDVP